MVVIQEVDPPNLDEAFYAVADTMAIPAHILLLVVLVRYRKKEAFSFDFFPMLLSLSVNDVIAAILLLVNKISRLFMMNFVVKYCPTLFQLLTYGVPWFGGITGDALILVGIATNRLIVFLFPMRHQQLWRPIHTRMVIILQWSCAIAHSLTFAHPGSNVTYSWKNGTTDILMSSSYPDSAIEYGRMVSGALMTFLAGVIIALFYSISVVKLVHYKLTTNGAGQLNLVEQGKQESQLNLVAEIRLAIQGFLLSFGFVVLFIVGFLVLVGFEFGSSVWDIFNMAAHSNFVSGLFIVLTYNYEQ